MTKTKYQGHTPGPWTAVNDTLVRGPHGTPVAATRCHDTYPHDVNHAANARLIADAPALLARVERLETLLHRCNIQPAAQDPTLENDIRAALDAGTRQDSPAARLAGKE